MKRIFAVLLLVTGIMLFSTVVHAQTIGGGQHQATPTIPLPESTIFQTNLNSMMGLPVNGTDGEPLEPFDAGSKEYMEAVAFESKGLTFICPNDREILKELAFSERENRYSLNIVEHNNEHAAPYANRVHWEIDNTYFEILHIDIHEGVYHLSGFADINQFHEDCRTVTTESLVTFDMFGTCDGSEAYITVREPNSWSMKFTDAQHSAACLTAPP